jgi:regulator of protease activity HflC (stomatin/prohibitin superfamily)
VMPAVALAWLISGIVCVRSNERAVVTRFGKAREELSPGLYWRYPSPFERVYRERVDELRTLQLGFRAPEDRPAIVGRTPLPVEWTSEHNEPGFELRPEESLVLTGDEVLVEMTAEVQWQISDLRTYLFGSARPAETLRKLTESVLREMAAQQPLDGILTDRRRRIEERCLVTLRRRLEHYSLGISVAGLTLLDVHPPLPAVPDYRDVANALEEREQSVNQAEAYYATRLLSAAGERALRTLDAATADPRKRTEQSTVGAVSGWNLTDELWSRLSEDHTPAGFALSGESASLILTARQTATETTESARGQAARFNELLSAYRAQPHLTGLRLYWQAITDSLSNRAITVIDPKAGGRKRLFLAGPDDIRTGALIKDSESDQSPSGVRPESPPENREEKDEGGRMKDE